MDAIEAASPATTASRSSRTPPTPSRRPCGDRKVGRDRRLHLLLAVRDQEPGRRRGRHRRPCPTTRRRRPCGCSARRASPATPGSALQTRTLGHYDVVAARAQGEPGRPAGGGGAAQARPDRRAPRPPRRRWSSATTRASPGWPASSRSAGPRSASTRTTCTSCAIDPALAGADRDRYAAALMAENIATGLHFLPVHLLTWYREHLPGAACRRPSARAPRCCRCRCRRRTTRRDIDDALAALREAPRGVHADEPADTRRGSRRLLSAVLLVVLLWCERPGRASGTR